MHTFGTQYFKTPNEKLNHLTSLAHTSQLQGPHNLTHLPLQPQLPPLSPFSLSPRHTGLAVVQIQTFLPPQALAALFHVDCSQPTTSHPPNSLGLYSLALFKVPLPGSLYLK